MTYDPLRRGDPPGRDTGGLGTRAALALAAFLLVAGVVATSALAGSGAPPVASGSGPSRVALAGGTGAA